MKKTPIHIGTSGWSFDEWNHIFYPDKLPVDERLHYYAGQFNSVEINSSFYHLPSKTTLEKWVDATPDSFLFTMKASRYITHMKRLKQCEEPVQNFLERMRILGKKAGPVLFQLPPSFAADTERLNLIQTLPDTFQYVFEFRHPSWFQDDVYNLLSRKNIAFCVYELEHQTSPMEVTADFTYIRLHGPGEKYEGLYGRKGLRKWVNFIEACHHQHQTVFIYFDNTFKAEAPHDARTMVELCRELDSTAVR